MLRILVLALTLSTASFSPAAAFDHGPLDDLLKKYVLVVDQGRASQVDYRGLQTERQQLGTYLQGMAGVSRAEFDSWPPPRQLAFLINAYNGWTLELILTAYPEIKSIKELGSLFQSPWEKKFIPLLGETLSLDGIEHALIRGSGRYNDPRIHFAVNCASIGCPALRAEAFTAEQLEEQLEEATRLFLADRSRNRLADTTLEISSIFKWYRGDFEQGWRGASSLERFLALYADSFGLQTDQATALAEGRYRIRFLDYDWQLNDTK
jgi:hypothetical protein